MERITAIAIIEILGAPAEHITKTLKSFIEKLKKDGHKIKKESYVEPTEKGKLFSCFVEIEIEFNDVGQTVQFCLDALPSSIEIVQPETIPIDASALNPALNDLMAKLHVVDNELKRLKATNELIDQNAVALFRNFIMYLIAQSPKTLEEISKIIGIKDTHLEAFLNRMAEQHMLESKDGKYHSVENKDSENQ